MSKSATRESAESHQDPGRGIGVLCAWSLALAVAVAALLVAFVEPVGVPLLPRYTIYVLIFIETLVLGWFCLLEARAVTLPNLASPFLFFSLGMALHFVIRPLGMWMSPALALKEVFFASPTEERFYWVKALILLILFSLVVGATYVQLAARRRPTAGPWPPAGKRAWRPTLPQEARVCEGLAIAYLVVAAGGVLLMTGGDLAGFLAIADRNAYVQTPQGRLGLAMMLFAAPVPLFAYSGIVMRNKGMTVGTVLTFALPTMASLGAIALHRGRTLMLVPVFACFVFHSLVVKPIRISGIVLLGLSVIAFVLITDIVETGVNVASAITGLGNSMLTFVDVSGSSFDNVVEVIRKTPRPIPHDFGYHFFGILFDFMPAAERPISGSEEFTRLFFPDVHAMGRGRAGPMLSEFYWSFSIAGVVLLGVGTGGMLAILHHWRVRIESARDRNLQMRSAIMYSFLFYSLCHGSFGSFTQTLPVIILYFAILGPVVIGLRPSGVTRPHSGTIG